MGHPALDRVLAKALAAWLPPPDLTVSQWAGANRELTSRSSAEPGRWRNERSPHLILPMDLLSADSDTRRVVLKFSSQSAKTEAILNFIGYIIDCDPGPILVIQPNIEPMAERFSKQRIAPMIQSAPSLREKVGEEGKRTASTILEKIFPGGALFIGGANSPAGLASMPIRYFLGDEIDRWEITREGDALSLARERLETYRNNRQEKELLTSSPTYDDIGISVEYDRCLTQYQRHLRCDHCGETQFPRLKHFSRNADGALRYVCEHCGAEHPPGVQRRLKLSGEWVATRSDGEESAGFWMNRFASPFSRWEDTVNKWDAVQKSPAEKQVIVNTHLAEGWQGEGDRADPSLLESRCEDYDAELPDGVAAITIGVDVQQDRLEAEVVGWGQGHESWSLAYAVLLADPTQPEEWEELVELWKRPWAYADGSKITATALAIDSGNWTRHVYDWVRLQHHRNVYSIKGASNFGADVLTGSALDRMRRIPKRMRDGRPPESIGVGQIKLTIDRALAKTEPGAWYCHFPTGRGREYFDQLTGERLMPVKTTIRPRADGLAAGPRGGRGARLPRLRLRCAVVVRRQTRAQKADTSAETGA